MNQEEAPDNSQLADQARHCRLQTTHSQDKVKIWIEAKATGVEEIAAQSLAQLGGAHTRGTPPRSRAPHFFSCISTPISRTAPGGGDAASGPSGR